MDVSLSSSFWTVAESQVENWFHQIANMIKPTKPDLIYSRLLRTDVSHDDWSAVVV